MAEDHKFSPSMSPTGPPSASLSPSLAPPEEVEKKALDKAKIGLEGQPAKKEDLDRLYYIMLAVVIALFIGFAGTFVATSAMLWQAWKDKEHTYQELVDKVNQIQYDQTRYRQR